MNQSPKDPAAAVSTSTVKAIHVERDATTARIIIDRPGTRNALGPAEWAELRAALASLAADREVRVLVITGAGGAFSAGGDLKTMPERLGQPLEQRRKQLLGDSAVIRAIVEIDRPVVALIDGAASGAGLALALACDLRLASERSSFAAPFHRVGLSCDFGLSWLLTRSVGPARAADLLYSGASLDARRAAEMGLVTRVYPDADFARDSEAYIAALARGPALAHAATKRALRVAMERPLVESLAFEANAQAECSRTEDAREGVAAFLERRGAEFGRR